MPTLLVCSSSEEESALLARWPTSWSTAREGVLDLLAQLADDARDLRA